MLGVAITLKNKKTMLKKKKKTNGNACWVDSQQCLVQRCVYASMSISVHEFVCV